MMKSVLIAIRPQWVEKIDNYGKGKTLYGWHISDLKIYDKPRELSEFYKPCSCSEKKSITRAPQSWQYIEDLGEKE